MKLSVKGLLVYISDIIKTIWQRVKALMFFFFLLLFQPSQRFDWDSLSKVKLLYKPKWPMGSGLNSGFLSMKWLGVLLLPPGWDASPSQGYPQLPHIATLGEEKHCESKVSCVRTQHNDPDLGSNPEHSIRSRAH